MPSIAQMLAAPQPKPSPSMPEGFKLIKLPGQALRSRKSSWQKRAKGRGWSDKSALGRVR